MFGFLLGREESREALYIGANPTSLRREVLTSSQEPAEPGGRKKKYPGSVPVSFNTPRTSAWNKWTSTSQRLLLPRCLLSLSYLSPPTLTSSQRDAAGVFFPPPSPLFFTTLSSSVSSRTQRHRRAIIWRKSRGPRWKPVTELCTAVQTKTLCFLLAPLWNAGAHSRVLLPARDVRQQQRLPSGNEGGQEDGVRCGSAGVGQEARRPCQDQQDGTSQHHWSRNLYALYIWWKHYLFIYRIVIPPLFLLAVH